MCILEYLVYVFTKFILFLIKKNKKYINNIMCKIIKK